MSHDRLLKMGKALAAISGGCLIVAAVSALLGLILGARLWSLKVVDIAVVCGVVAVVLVIGWIASVHVRDTTLPEPGADATESSDAAKVHGGEGLVEKLLPAAGAGLGLILTVFVAYGALRNQSRLTAEIAINEDGGRIAEWERENPAVRCLYSWFDDAPPRAEAGDRIANACLARIVADRETYTEVMLYIEEAFYLLGRAARDRKQWGSTYYSEIKYWQSDVGEDQTGLFAFHLLNRYPLEPAPPGQNLEAAKREMRAAGVEIGNLCVGGQRVRTCLEATGRFADPLPSECAGEVPPASHRRLLAVEQVCRAEANRLAQARKTQSPAAP